jgi:hypothetical protein
MSRLFGDVRQLGYVVPDIHAAMRHWAEVLGIGPWFYTGCNQIEDGVINGKSASFSVNIALANTGDMQIKLIETFERAGGSVLIRGEMRARNSYIWTHLLNKAPCLNSPLCQTNPGVSSIV